jgi:hypothetical protein
MSCPWWKPAHDTKEGVSLRQRLRCLVYGAQPDVPTPDDAQLIEIGIRRFDRANDYLVRVAHGSGDADRRLVKTEMRTLERHILLVLKRRAQEQERHGAR